MCNKNLKTLSCMVLVAGALSGLAGCSCIPSKIQTNPDRRKTITSDVDDTTTAYNAEGQEQKMERDPDEMGQDAGSGSEDIVKDRVSPGEVEIVNAAEFGNPKEVLDHMPIASNVTVIKTGEDELQIEFELENVGLCTFAAGKGEKFVLPNEVFVDSTKIEWTASTADGEYLFPYMRVNETGDMFIKESFQLTFEEIQEIAGIPIDHSFLKYKKELAEYGWQVGKISMKEQTVCFHKVD